MNDKLQKILGQLGDHGAYPSSLTLLYSTSIDISSVFGRGIQLQEGDVPSLLFTPLDIPSSIKTSNKFKPNSITNQGAIFVMNSKLFQMGMAQKKIESSLIHLKIYQQIFLVGLDSATKKSLID